MLKDVEHLVANGFAVHLLRPRSKAPLEDLWSSAPVATLANLQKSYRDGQNLGVRLGEPSRVGDGFLHLIDLDIRDPDTAAEARAALKKLLPEAESLPTVASGSGGHSRHYYFVSDQAFRSKKLAHSDEKFVGQDGKQHWKWEIELFGSGKQAVIPPSIHPDTGKAYAWEKPFDFDALDLGIAPFVAAARVTGWGADLGPAKSKVQDEEDLLSLTRKKPMGLSEREIDDILTDLPLPDWCEDRDGWIQVGMALHHEFEGRPEGLQVWSDFSKQSGKFDAEDQARVWRSFAGKASPVRMATLLKAAAIARLSRDHAGDDFAADPEDDDDLIGDAEDEVDGIDAIGTDAADKKVIEWASRLDLNEEGKIKPTLHNLELIVRNDPRTAAVPRLNEFTQEVVQAAVPRIKLGKTPKGIRQLNGPIWRLSDPVNGDLWTEEKDGSLRSILEAPTRQGGYGIKISDRDLKAAVDLVARDNAFHPVQVYLNGLAWDQESRLETVFVRFLGAPDTPYIRSVCRLTFLGAVVRAFEAGHKFDFAAILEGSQGKRKSTFIAILAKHWFAELQGDFGDRKRMIEKMQGAWICELSELQGFSRTEVQELKAFISSTADKDRLAYARRAREFPRQCIFIGSTNEAEYLRDATGGRRFWPIPCGVDEIDTEALEAEVDQIWAEAVVIYRDMRAVQPHGTLPLFVSDSEARSEAESMQEARRVETVEDALAGEIDAWLEKPLPEMFEEDDDLIGPAPRLRDETWLLQVWTDCLGKHRSEYGSRDAAQLGRAMRRVPGWILEGPRRVPSGGTQRVYRRVPPV